MRAQRTATAGLLAALALILGWVDSMIPISTVFPGLKLGLANLAVVLALYRLGLWHAAAVSATKVLLSALLFGGVSGLMYSASGAAISLAVMASLYRCSALSPTGVSAAGGAAHIAAQFAVAAALTSTPALFRLMPPLLAVGTLTGAVLGIIALQTLRHLPVKHPISSERQGHANDEN